MKPNVLIVDDDPSFLRLLQKDLEVFADSFSVSIAESGSAALEILANSYVSVVVSDLRMPGMDGFELLTGILNTFPDIPVCMMTSYDKPKTEEVVYKSGAVGYLKKPFSAMELFAQITKMLNKKADGGSLHNVTLETFLQLIEMEQQTSTLRVIDKKDKKSGVLFFRNGELMNARSGIKQGKDAAYEILSWSNVSLTIEHDCVFKEKLIEGDLQAILLDAMRAKDEIADEIEPEEDGGGGEILLDSPLHGDQPDTPEIKVPPAKPTVTVAKVRPPVQKPADLPPMTPIDLIRMKIKNAVGARDGVLGITHDPDWDGLILQASKIGEGINCGRLNILYVHKENDEQFIVVAGAEVTSIAISQDSPRDRIIAVLA
ncbi:MAG: response regulator [Desulfobacteraceae bacterium]|nr:MAG: response regulator [Desulfobacteraceae bacterium]